MKLVGYRTVVKVVQKVQPLLRVFPVAWNADAQMSIRRIRICDKTVVVKGEAIEFSGWRSGGDSLPDSLEVRVLLVSFDEIIDKVLWCVQVGNCVALRCRQGCSR